MLVPDEFPDPVGAPTIVAVIPETVPVNVGDAKLAFKLSAVVTKAVVAICVVLVAGGAVGADGVPVNVGDAKGAFNATFPSVF